MAQATGTVDSGLRDRGLKQGNWIEEFRMIPVIFRTFHERQVEGMDKKRQDEAARNGLKEAGAALGFTSAIAAYGAFIIPKSYGTSTDLTGGPGQR